MSALPNDSDSPTTSEASPATTEQPVADATAETATPLRLRYRIRFAKDGLLRWTSHRDLARLWERLLRRAQLSLSMTEGFHPKPRISFPSALALGVSGLREVVELDLSEDILAADLLAKLASDQQPGLHLHSVQRIPQSAGKAKLKELQYSISLPDAELYEGSVDLNNVQQAIDALLQQDSVTIERKKKQQTFTINEQITTLTLSDQGIRLNLAASDGATLKPSDVLDLIGCADWVAGGSQITRTDVVLQRELEPTDPELFAQTNPSSPDDGTIGEV